MFYQVLPQGFKVKFVLLLCAALLALGAGLPVAQSQSQRYVMVERSLNAQEHQERYGSFLLWRFRGLHKALPYKMCFTGTATIEVDYIIRTNSIMHLPSSGGCITHNIPINHDRQHIYVAPVNDRIDESRESIILTLSEDTNNSWGNNVYVLRSVANVHIIDND